MHIPIAVLVPFCSLLASTSANCVGPQVNQATMNLVKVSEGLVPWPANDPVRLPTVGYGHKCQQTYCAEVTYQFPLNDYTATQLMLSDLTIAQNCITNLLSYDVYLTDNQYGALCSWAFNEGCANARSSTLIARLNNYEDPDAVAAQELPRWNLAGGQVSEGLITRRAREVALFQTYSENYVLPTWC